MVTPLCMQSNQPRQAIDRCWGGSSTITPKINERENTRKRNADNGGSTKTKKHRNRCVHRRSPTKLRDSEAPAPINTYKKEHDTAAKGFPRYAVRREEG